VDSAASFVQWQQDPDARDLDVVFGAAHIFHVPIGLALRRTCFYSAASFVQWQLDPYIFCLFPWVMLMVMTFHCVNYHGM
jgi:hypothetical protein